MTWWIIPLALATILADAVLDPDTREAVALGWRQFARGFGQGTDELFDLLAEVEERVEMVERGGYRPRPSLTQKSPPQGTRGVLPKCPVFANVGQGRCLTHSRFRDIGAPPKPRQVTTCSRCAGVGPGHCPEHMHDQSAPMSDLTNAEVTAFVEHGTVPWTHRLME